MQFNRGDKLGRFVIRGKVGAGGMGTVYRAYDATISERHVVAIKVLRLPEDQDSRSWAARFRREALAISDLADPHIVKIQEFVEGDDHHPPYLVMEYLEGQDLDALVRSTRLSITQAVDIILDVAHAVSLCHRAGWVHRDLKPANVFVADYDGVQVVKVLDFGIAKLHSPGSADADPNELTRPGSIIGTPVFAAPEILRGGAAAATPQSDQYSLGVVLYVALTGQRPFVAPPDADRKHADWAIWRAVLNHDFPLPHTLRPDIPDALERVLLRMMSEDPDERFPTVHEVGAALLPWASDRGRSHWSDHFTSVPRPVRPKGSVAIAVPPASSPSGPATLADLPLRSPAAAPAAPLPTLPTPPPPKRDISIDVPVSESDVEAPSADPPSVETSGPASRPSRRPIALLAGVAVLLAVALPLGLAIHQGRRPPAAADVAAPPLAPSVVAPAAPLRPLLAQPPVAPPPQPTANQGSAASSAPTATPPEPSVPLRPAARVRKHRDRHPQPPRRPLEDQNGIPIPPD